MILADTSIWIDHLRHGDAALAARLEAESILMHPLVLGEIAVGSLRNRTAILARLKLLPSAVLAHHYAVLHMIEGHSLHGLGLSYNDVHLLASARLMTEVQLWTRDKRLAAAAERLGIAAGVA